MKSTFLHRFVGLSLILLTMGIAATHLKAGGAAYPFRKTWRVHWASEADSLKFQHFLNGESAESACDVRACDLCHNHAAVASTPFPFADCPAHSADPKHRCPIAQDSRQPASGTARVVMPVDDDVPATKCSAANCQHCRVAILDPDSSPGKVCSHHDGNTVHLCHGVSVTVTGMYDSYLFHQDFQLLNAVEPARVMPASESGWKPVLQIPIQQVAAGGLRTLANGASGAYTEPKPAPGVGGVFEVQFEGMPLRPLQVRVMAFDDMQIAMYETQNGKLSFDATGFPAGEYKVIASDKAGARWEGRFMLQTNGPGVEMSNVWMNNH